jgi:hypothetical protein
VLSRSAIVSWMLRVAAAAALGIDAAVHARNASAYDTVGATVTQGGLFRVEAGLAVVAGLLVLVRPRRGSWVAALAVAAEGGAVVLAGLGLLIHRGARPTRATFTPTGGGRCQPTP